MSQIIDAILYARDLPWTQEILAGDESGASVEWFGSSAKMFCIEGQTVKAAQVNKLTVSDGQTLMSLMETVVLSDSDGEPTSNWNDDPSRTQSDIDNMWDRVLRLAKERNL